MRLLPGLLLAAALSLELGESKGHLRPHCSKPVPQPQPLPSPGLGLVTSGKPDSCPPPPFLGSRPSPPAISYLPRVDSTQSSPPPLLDPQAHQRSPQCCPCPCKGRQPPSALPRA